MLRTSALNIITELDVHGGCNVQYALNPDSFEYCVIEVNPRVSRSSALASKATGYPIAKVTAKIAIGYTLDEIENAVTKKTYASFEPMLDYCVVKMPRLPFDKFIHAKRTLTTQDVYKRQAYYPAPPAKKFQPHRIYVLLSEEGTIYRLEINTV